MQLFPSHDVLSHLQALDALNKIGIALSSQQDSNLLLETILQEAKRLTSADGGTLYTYTDTHHLQFEIMLTDSLNIHIGGSSGHPIPYPPLPIYNAQHEPNLQMVAVCAAVQKKTINITDAYSSTEFDFIGTKRFDEKTGYRSQSFLTVPLKDRNDQVIGVLQLLNAKNRQTGEIQAFTAFDQQLVESLASQAAVSLVNQRLLADIMSRVNTLETLNRVGVALSAQRNSTELLEMILKEAKILTNADGGTLYLRNDQNQLNFEIMLTDSLHIHSGGTSGKTITLPPISLYDKQGQPNLHTVVVAAAIQGETINIPDVYADTRFDFTGTKKFDEKMGYRSQSFLTVPMKDHQGEVIGVLQLLNAIHPKTNQIRAFDTHDQKTVESLASQAAVAYLNQRLLADQKRLFEAFIQLIATAIDQKSPYTGGHCRRIPELTMMLAEATIKTQNGIYKDFTLTEEEKYELSIAGWLHDCGKITTPEYVVDKATKLETIFDRIHLIDTRFEVLKRDAEIALLKQQITAYQTGQPVETQKDQEKLTATLETLNNERDFIRRYNTGGEFMPPEAQAKIREISQRTWTNPKGENVKCLSEEELYNLTISKGTLTPEERNIINHHIVATINMLESLPYPKHLRRVPEYAGGHHERMDGKGYPKGLTREQMSIPARMMGIADIFEALTASDRPYKKAMPLSQALTILGKMKLDNHIDPDLFDVFIREKVYLQYAQQFLAPEQIDTFDITKIPGYRE